MDAVFLNGRRVLFIGHILYDYHQKIIDQLRESGAEVDFFENKIFASDEAVNKALLGRLTRFFQSNAKAEYVDYIINEISNNQYDYLFCLGCFSITSQLVSTIRNRNPGIECILYLWDSFKIWNYKDLIVLFDRAYSFDSEDCRNFSSLTYLPLFYTSEYKSSDHNETNIDLLYVGSVGAITIERCSILKKLQVIAESKNLTTYFLLYYPSEKNLMRKIIRWIRRFFSSSEHYLNVIQKFAADKNSFIKQKSLNREELSVLLKRANCVIDLPVSNQSGLTIRTIETLAAGKKLLTTNINVINEDFYDGSMIKILKEPFDIDVMFLEKSGNSLNIDRLWIGNWIASMFLSGKNLTYIK